MSHEIETFEDGSAAFFSAREVAWHRLGVVTPDCLTAEDALVTAQLDWEVQLRKLYANGPQGATKQRIVVPDFFATVRTHPKLGEQPLGVVGNRYQPIQNREAFQVLDDIVDQSGAHFETAGSIYNGRRVFVTMKMPEHMDFGGREALDLYLLAWNSHDGTQAFTLAVTPVRVVCKNTLDYAMRTAQRTFKIRHTESASERIQQAREALELTFKFEGALMEDVEALLNKAYTDEQFTALVSGLFPMPEEPTQPRVALRVAGIRDELHHLWNAPTQAGIKGTAWGALQSVVEWADYYAPVRSKDEAGARAMRIMTGDAAIIKQDAYKQLIAA